MRIPTQFKFGYQTWKVRMVTRFPGGEEDRLGECDYRSRTIRILKTLPQDEQEEVFLHELLHVVWPQHVVSPRTEERIIESIDGALLHVLRSTGSLPKKTRKPRRRHLRLVAAKKRG